MPILGDLQKALYDTGEEYAKRVANSLEIYVSGSLNIFNHRTNVDLNNRIICYNIKKLKNTLRNADSSGSGMEQSVYEQRKEIHLVLYGRVSSSA